MRNTTALGHIGIIFAQHFPVALAFSWAYFNVWMSLEQHDKLDLGQIWQILFKSPSSGVGGVKGYSHSAQDFNRAIGIFWVKVPEFICVSNDRIPLGMDISDRVSRGEVEQDCRRFRFEIGQPDIPEEWSKMCDDHELTHRRVIKRQQAPLPWGLPILMPEAAAPPKIPLKKGTEEGGRKFKCASFEPKWHIGPRQHNQRQRMKMCQSKCETSKNS